jgi:DNA-binding CsgD family transcriptional regulator
MNPFHEMLRKVTSSPCHDKVRRFVDPLEQAFGINHFWYYKISHSGNYTYFGTHAKWSEFCFDKAMLKHFSCLRDPQIIPQGISFMKANADQDFKEVLDNAWNRFNINFTINVVERKKEGIEAFGFATKFNDPLAEQRLINEFSLLRFFITEFKKAHTKLFDIMDSHQINLPKYFGQTFYERPKMVDFSPNREYFLKKMGFMPFTTLTPKEKEILTFIARGFPASFIAKSLNLSRRTVENYIANIKTKLNCNSKVELIQKSLHLIEMNF